MSEWFLKFKWKKYTMTLIVYISNNANLKTISAEKTLTLLEMPIIERKIKNVKDGCKTY